MIKAEIQRLILELSGVNLIGRLKVILGAINASVVTSINGKKPDKDGNISIESGGQVRTDNKTIFKNKEGEIQLGEKDSYGDYKLDIEGLVLGEESLGLGLSKKQITLIEGEDTSSMFKDKFQIVANGRTLDLLFPKPLTTSEVVVTTSVNGITADEKGNIEIPSGGIDIQGRKNNVYTGLSLVYSLGGPVFSFVGRPVRDCEILALKEWYRVERPYGNTIVTVGPFSGSIEDMKGFEVPDTDNPEYDSVWKEVEDYVLSLNDLVLIEIGPKAEN